MDDLPKFLRAIFLAAVWITGCLLGGCAGPSTRVLPQESKEVMVPKEELPVLEESNPFYLQEELEILAGTPRAGGSEEEREAIRYIRQLLEDYGYDTSLQQFSSPSGAPETDVSGINVVAVRETSKPEADIVIVSACHDTLPWSPGASESASGVAALLETARLLSRMPTDTELRFVSFSRYSKGQTGSRYYVESLSEEERHRVIGVVHLGGLGCSINSGIMLESEDGKPTMLGDALRDASQELLQENWFYGQQEGEHSPFVRGRVPAVTVSQQREAFEAGSRFDRPELVDIERLAQVVNVVSRAIFDIMSPDTPSMLAKAHHYNDLRDDAYIQPIRQPIGFGETPQETENRLGIRGFLAAENTDGEGNTIQSWEYPVKWLGVGQVLLTTYYYQNGRLDTIAVDGDGAGVDMADMRERLVSVYGEPIEETEGPNGIAGSWQDVVGRTAISMTPETDGYELEFREYPTEKILLDSYEIIPAAGQNPQLGLGRREMENAGAQDPRVNVLLTLVRQLLPMGDGQRLRRIDFYTDGIGETKTALEILQPEEDEEAEEQREPEFIWGLDLEDALTAEGKWRNETDMIRQILLLYGQMLEQIEEYRTDFEIIFSDENSAQQVELGVKPGDYKEPLPDLKESFVWFVLTDRPGEAGGNWGARIQFFYRYEELIAYRTQIRNNLKIDP